MKKVELTVGGCDMDTLEELLYSRGVKTYVTVEFDVAQAQGEESGEGDGARETRIEFYLSDDDADGAVPAILDWCREVGNAAMIAVFAVEERIAVRTRNERSFSGKKVAKCSRSKNRVF